MRVDCIGQEIKEGDTVASVNSYVNGVKFYIIESFTNKRVRLQLFYNGKVQEKIINKSDRYLLKVTDEFKNVQVTPTDVFGRTLEIGDFVYGKGIISLPTPVIYKVKGFNLYDVLLEPIISSTARGKQTQKSFNLIKVTNTDQVLFTVLKHPKKKK